jgi:SSS family solute:Na+ symporter
LSPASAGPKERPRTPPFSGKIGTEDQETDDPMTELSAADLATIALYFVIVVALGLWVGRGERNAEDFFLAGRRLPWFLIGLSYFASNMSGASFVGLTAAAYEYGLVVFNYEWTATLVLIVFALFMLPVFLRTRLFTVPEYLERRYDARTRRAYAAFTIIAVLLIDTAGALYAGGVVITVAFPAVSLFQASAALALIAGLYTIFGGLRAVVVTDALQAVLIIAGGALILAVGLIEVGGWQGLMDGLQPERRELIRPLGDPFLPWPGILGVILLGFYYWALNQYFVQRALGARSPDDGRRGALFGGLLKLPNLFVVIVPGVIAYRLFPGLDHPDLAFPALAFELLPVGLRGLVLTALVAAIMSSLDSALNAAASLATMDFVRPWRPQVSERTLLTIGRIFTTVAMVLAVVYVPIIRAFGTLFEYFQSTLAYVTPPVVAVYLLGLVWRRATPAGGFWGLATGIAMGLLLFAAQEVSDQWAAAGLPPLHYTSMALVMFAFAGAVVVGVSLLGAPPPAILGEATVRRSDLLAGTDAPRVLIEAVVLSALMAALIIAFW